MLKTVDLFAVIVNNGATTLIFFVTCASNATMTLISRRLIIVNQIKSQKITNL